MSDLSMRTLRERLNYCQRLSGVRLEALVKAQEVLAWIRKESDDPGIQVAAEKWRVVALPPNRNRELIGLDARD